MTSHVNNLKHFAQHQQSGIFVTVIRVVNLMSHYLRENRKLNFTVQCCSHSDKTKVTKNCI